MLKLKKIQVLAKGVNQLELPYIAGGNAKWQKYFENSLEVSCKVMLTLTIQFSDSNLRYLSERNENMNTCKDLNLNVHCSCIHSNPHWKRHRCAPMGKWRNCIHIVE